LRCHGSVASTGGDDTTVVGFAGSIGPAVELIGPFATGSDFALNPDAVACRLRRSAGVAADPGERAGVDRRAHRVGIVLGGRRRDRGVR